jgi:flavoprotein
MNNWDNLTQNEVDVYVSRAEYLIQKGYVQTQDIQNLAQKIFLSEKITKSEKHEDEK